MGCVLSAHTPGPWKALGLLVPFGYVIKYDKKNGDESIAYIQAYDIENEEPEPYGKWSSEAKANHDLVLAAPDLLEALQYAIKQVPELADVPGIAAAIAKATGDQT